MGSRRGRGSLGKGRQRASALWPIRSAPAVGAGQVLAGQGGPLVGDAPLERFLPGLAVPVAGVVEVALLAVEVGVDARAVGGVELAGQLVGALPVARAVQPERPQDGRQVRRLLAA